MDKTDISFNVNGEKFNYRVCAVMINDGRILTMRDEHSPLQPHKIVGMSLFIQRKAAAFGKLRARNIHKEIHHYPEKSDSGRHCRARLSVYGVARNGKDLLRKDTCHGG